MYNAVLRDKIHTGSSDRALCACDDFYSSARADRIRDRTTDNLEKANRRIEAAARCHSPRIFDSGSR